MDISLKFSDIKLSKSAVFEEMGYGKDTPDERVLKLVDELFRKAEETVKPAFHYQFSNGNLENGCICCDNAVFHVNSTIATLLKHSEKFVFFAATAGNDYQDYHNQLSDSGDSLTLFIWDAIGSCIAEATGDLMEKYLEKELDGMPHTNRFSPGYCGWHVSEQKILFSIMPEKVCGITLNDSALMYPIKSISGVIGCGAAVDTRKYGCQFCELENCYKKRKKNNSHI